ncbi:MAG: 2-polyprenyl-3-methyl-5-hydroxy-6-metoxy-1,4-benzoquinol methylase, partial [Akkermansiaceae bacterium]
MNAGSLDHCEWAFIKEGMKREVKPELLDSLPGDDPEALRSRRDLRLINFLMGNERWIMRQEIEGGMIELGAGSGYLTKQLATMGTVIGLDYQEKP